MEGGNGNGRAAQVILSILVWVLIAGGYVYYRRSQSSNEKVLAYLGSGVSISSTQCSSYGSTGFQGTLGGTLFFDGSKMRANISRVEEGDVQQGHAVSTDGRTFYVWMNEAQGFVMDREQFNAAYDFSKTTLTCSIWWSPNPLFFEKPAFTPFKEE